MFGRLHRPAEEHLRSLDHRRRPRGQTDTLLFLLAEFTGEETLDVIRIVREQQQGVLHGVWMIDGHVPTGFGALQTVQQQLVAVSREARLGVNSVGVERVVPHPKRPAQGHAGGLTGGRIKACVEGCSVEKKGIGKKQVYLVKFQRIFYHERR